MFYFYLVSGWQGKYVTRKKYKTQENKKTSFVVWLLKTHKHTAAAQNSPIKKCAHT